MAVRSTYEIWQTRAECRGPGARLFFPPTYQERKDEREERERRAKAICASCGVRRDCLDYAMSIRELHGIWGGLTEAERRSVLAQQAG